MATRIGLAQLNGHEWQQGAARSGLAQPNGANGAIGNPHGPAQPNDAKCANGNWANPVDGLCRGNLNGEWDIVQYNSLEPK